MVILALETATRRGSLAIDVDGRIEAVSGGDLSATHAERLPGEAVGALARHGRRISDVDLFAVISGPGSFTGLRVGIAAVQGWALACGRPVVAVPTLDALMCSWLQGAVLSPTLAIACLDGQRGEVFVSAFAVPAGARSLAMCKPLLEPHALKPEDLADILPDRHGLPVVVIGDGGRRYAEVFQRIVPGAAIVEPSMTLAEGAVHLATADSARQTPPHAIRPIYLRRPDALIARDRARAMSLSGPRFTVRSATPRDLPGVEALQRQTFTNPWGADAIRWELENTDVARLYVMETSEHELVAYCACWMVFDELHINSLAVGEGRRRQGVGRQLLQFLLREAAQAGARSATLEVRSSNLAARALYDRFGFKIEGVRRDYYQDPREDAIILWNRDIDKALTT